MLYHHDSRDYDTAASEAATAARATMDQLIERGRLSARRVFQHVETSVPDDAIARGRALRWGYAAPEALRRAAEPVYLGADAVGLTNDEGVPVNIAAVLDEPVPAARADGNEVPELVMQIAERTHRVHAHALGQVAGVAGVPFRYLRDLAASPNPALRALATEILGTHFERTNKGEGRYLLRAVDGQVRGFLSDRYRRLDNRPLLAAFAEACQQVGALPVDGAVSDVRCALKAYLPLIFEPVPNEPMLVGLQWHNSDFGAGAHCLALTVLRLACTNKAVLTEAVRDVHLGRKLPDDVAFSERTYQLDTEANASALRDSVIDLLSPAKVNALVAACRAAHEQQIGWTQWAPAIRKSLSKAESSEAQRLFESEEIDIVRLPPGRTAWRASNVLSWLAGSADSTDRRLELERLAGAVLDPIANRKAA